VPGRKLGMRAKRLALSKGSDSGTTGLPPSLNLGVLARGIALLVWRTLRVRCTGTPKGEGAGAYFQDTRIAGEGVHVVPRC
jgi:hypothetical protein